MKKQRLIFWGIFMVLLLTGGMRNEAKAADVQDTATILNMDGQWSRDYWLTGAEDVHYHKIVIPADGYFSFKIMSYIDGWLGGRCYYELFSADLSEKYYDEYVWGGTEVSPKSASHYTSLSKGTYILKIKVDDGDSGKYKLQSTYKNHYVNDFYAVSYDSPQEFAMGNSITGALTETDREDWYRIKITKAGYYTFFCKNYVDNSLYYELYSADLLSTIIDNHIYNADETEPKTKQDDVFLEAGTYYIKVTGGLNATGRYILSWDSLTQSNCDHSYTEKNILSTYTRRGYTLYKCEKCGKAYKGEYTAKKKLRRGYISIYSSGGKGKLYLQWGTVYDASGYQIRYCRNKAMKKGVKTKTVKGRSKYKKTIKRLSRKKKYYVQVRAYRKSGSKIIYGKWSAKRCIRTK